MHHLMYILWPQTQLSSVYSKNKGIDLAVPILSIKDNFFSNLLISCKWFLFKLEAKLIEKDLIKPLTDSHRILWTLTEPLLKPLNSDNCAFIWAVNCSFCNCEMLKHHPAALGISKECVSVIRQRYDQKRSLECVESYELSQQSPALAGFNLLSVNVPTKQPMELNWWSAVWKSKFIKKALCGLRPSCSDHRSRSKSIIL